MTGCLCFPAFSSRGSCSLFSFSSARSPALSFAAFPSVLSAPSAAPFLMRDSAPSAAPFLMRDSAPCASFRLLPPLHAADSGKLWFCGFISVYFQCSSVSLETSSLTRLILRRTLPNPQLLVVFQLSCCSCFWFSSAVV